MDWKCYLVKPLQQNVAEKETVSDTSHIFVRLVKYQSRNFLVECITKPYFPTSLTALAPIPIGTLVWHQHLPKHCGMDLQDYLGRISYNSHHNLFLEGVHQDRHLCSSIIVVHRPHSKKDVFTANFKQPLKITSVYSLTLARSPMASDFCRRASDFSEVLTWTAGWIFAKNISKKLEKSKIKINFKKCLLTLLRYLSLSGVIVSLN